MRLKFLGSRELPGRLQEPAGVFQSILVRHEPKAVHRSLMQSNFEQKLYEIKGRAMFEVLPASYGLLEHSRHIYGATLG